MSIIKTDLLKRLMKHIKNSENFEQDFYPRIIKRFKTEKIQVKGFGTQLIVLKT